MLPGPKPTPVPTGILILHVEESWVPIQHNVAILVLYKITNHVMLWSFWANRFTNVSPYPILFYPPSCQVSSWSIQPFIHNTPTLQTDRQTDRQTTRSDSTGRTVYIQTVVKKIGMWCYVRWMPQMNQLHMELHVNQSINQFICQFITFTK